MITVTNLPILKEKIFDTNYSLSANFIIDFSAPRSFLIPLLVSGT